ncbi:MAG: glycosyltransferase [Clostridia bacterium]|nr:glycosyltransferase [Clostridia bacterium]
MKVLIVNLRIGTGSVGRIVSDLYQGIIASGNECKIAYARGNIGDIPVEDTYRICSEQEVMLHAGLTRAFGNTAFYFKNSTKRFCRWIETFHPDIIHLHGAYGYYLNMEVLFKYFKESNVTVVSTLHSCWDFTGHCCYFDYINCDQWKTGCKHCRNKNSYPSSSILDNTARNYKRKKRAYEGLNDCTIVTPSKWMARYAQKSFLSNREIKVIYNGVDLNSFKKYEEKSSLIANNKPTILCVASIWEKRKGWDDVIELSHIIPETFQLIVVGLTEKQKEQLSKETIAIERTDSKEELAKLYSSATVFFNPTYEDNYPTVNLEAIACNTPVITYDTGGSPEAIKNESWGLVIAKRDYSSLFRYTKEVYQCQREFDKSEIEAISNAHMVSEYMTLYEGLTL